MAVLVYIGLSRRVGGTTVVKRVISILLFPSILMSLTHSVTGLNENLHLHPQPAARWSVSQSGHSDVDSKSLHHFELN